MPNVVANAQVAHLWTHQAQDAARSGNGNFWFEGDTIYSYSTPIARIVTDAAGRRVALVSTQRYSMTTNGKHFGAIGRATDYGRSLPTFDVPFIGAFGGRHNRADTRGVVNHDANLQHFAAAYTDCVARLSRKRDFDHVYALSDLLRVSEAAQFYARAFDIPEPAFNPTADVQRMADAYAARNTPAQIAKRTRAAELRAAAKAAREARETAERLERFRAGYHAGYFSAPDGSAFLRARGDVLETSLGASVPLDHAVKAFRFVKLCRERGETFTRNGRVVRVGHFTVDRIEANGDFRAGCHSIRWDECERLALTLGVFDAPASADAVTAA